MKLPANTLLPGLALILMTNAFAMNDDMLPDRIAEWTIASDTIYTPSNLFEYINGGAELYLSFGFREVVSKRYEAGGKPDIVVDIFNMNSPGDAYGVFMNSAEEISDLVGQGTQYNEGFLLFWMDHYFVSIMAWPENQASKDAMMKIARNIETHIGKEGDLPAILDYLPEEGLDPISVRYFHHHAWLNTHYYIASEDILQIGKTTDAVLAKYGKPGKQSVLLIVEYPSGEKASQAAKSFTSIYLPELREEGSMKLEDGSYTGIKQKGKILILVFNAPAGEEIEGLMSGVQKKIEPNNP